MIAVIFDTETTGLIKPGASKIEEQPYITDLYMLKVEHMDDGSIVKIDDYESLLKVPIPLSSEITRITGLTDESLANSPTFSAECSRIAKFMTGVDRLVAHNLAFDRSMLANELVRINRVLKFPWPREHVCTVEKSIYIEQRRMSLTRLHEHFFGKGFDDAHRAKTDVNALFKCYVEMCKQGMI